MIDVKSDAGIAVLTLMHGKANALDVEFCEALAARFVELRGADAKAVVLTGQDKIFSAGVDLIRLSEGGADYVRKFLPALHKLYDAVFNHPKPVVAAINGHAIAGGCVMTCAADYRVMAEGKATIGVPELKVGVPFPLVAIEILRFATLAGRLQELLFLGKTYLAKDAVLQGLADEIVPAGKLEERAIEIATRLTQEPVARFRITKEQLRRPTREAIARHSAETDEAMIRAWEDATTLKAIAAYLEATVGKKEKGEGRREKGRS